MPLVTEFIFYREIVGYSLPNGNIHHSNPSPGMFGLQNLPLFARVDMRVNLGRGDGTMAKQTLNVADIHIFFQQQGCKRVTECVGRDMFFDVCSRNDKVNHLTHRLCG